MAKIVILSGPACVGKGPLQKAFKYAVWGIRPEDRLSRSQLPQELGTVPIFHSRDPRDDELCGDQFIFERCLNEECRKKCLGQNWRKIAKHPCKTKERNCEVYDKLLKIPFERGSKIKIFSMDKFIIEQVRSDFQAIELKVLEQTVHSEEKRLVILELFHTLAKRVKSRLLNMDIQQEYVTTIFLSPLSESQISAKAEEYMGNEAEVIYRTMRSKLEKRATEKGDKLEARAAYACIEMGDAHNYEYIIVNPYGEDDLSQWQAFAHGGKDRPLKIGKGAAQALKEFAKYCGNIYLQKVDEWLERNVV